jgi:hypothetical protein
MHKEVTNTTPKVFPTTTTTSLTLWRMYVMQMIFNSSVLLVMMFWHLYYTYEIFA